MTVNMEIGLCHPPVGLNLYVASGIAKMGITELTIAVWPWLLTMLVFLVIVTYVPELVAVAAAHARDALARRLRHAASAMPSRPMPARSSARRIFSISCALGFTSGGRTTAEGMRPRMTSASFMRLCMSTTGLA